ncbi:MULTISPECIES: hypothetical protein [Methylobacteriaceae]|uniref:Uncharacterized protein n=1 Tax=Methylorubrum podarium TaxID=200476 RepID=A0ABV1QJ71_9HYPH|nr:MULTISPECIES: hypothetical protein [Methylobacteriaceae]KNY19992.1 hypothetical protein AKJ13_24885 [Methylobacterium sp. ARG-1]QIJ76403.1 hypothetical protein CLZ_18545 [Methylobacterium sp. CLZ]QIJ81306.1 hypothetical protein GU700_18550 [Methylobacterium sp. NI91]
MASFRMAISAGTKVSDRTKAATSAMMTVGAIGSNILPSTLATPGTVLICGRTIHSWKVRR